MIGTLAGIAIGYLVPSMIVRVRRILELRREIKELEAYYEKLSIDS